MTETKELTRKMVKAMVDKCKTDSESCDYLATILMEDHRLNRAAAEELFLWASQGGDPWRVRLMRNLMEKFVESAQDHWWKKLWKIAVTDNKAQTTWGDGSDNFGPNAREEIAILLLSVPGASLRQLMDVAETTYSDQALAALMIYVGQDTAAIKQILSRREIDEETNGWGLGFYAKGMREQGNTVPAEIAKMVLLEGFWVPDGGISGWLMDGLPDEILSEVLPDIIGRQKLDREVIEWLRGNGSKRVAGFSRDSISRMIGSPNRDIRVAVIGALGGKRSENTERTGEAKAGIGI